MDPDLCQQCLHRFICQNKVDTKRRYIFQAMSEDGSTASVTPQHCKAGQTTTDIPTDNSGIRIGATLQMTVKRKICF